MKHTQKKTVYWNVTKNEPIRKCIRKVRLSEYMDTKIQCIERVDLYLKQTAMSRP